MLGFSDDGLHLRMRERNEAVLRSPATSSTRGGVRMRTSLVETWLVPAGPLAHQRCTR